jgi:acetylornithine deacetylase
MNDAAGRAASFVDEQEVVELLQRLVNIPSVTGNESEIAQALVGELEATGCDEASTLEFRPGRDNAVGVLRGAGGGPGLMLLGHTDTVHVSGWEERWKGTDRESPYCGTIVDGEMFGRGVADQKGGIAACIAAVRAIRRAGLRLRGDISFAFVGDEEGGEVGVGYSDGVKAVVAKVQQGELPRPDFAIYTEPTQLRVDVAQIGFFCADIKIVGKSTYFATPWLGVDAIKAGTAFLNELIALSDELPKRGEHPLLGKQLLVLTGIKAGGYIAVSGDCTISLIQTVLPGQTLADARDELDALVSRVAAATGVEASVEYTTPRDDAVGGSPNEVPADDPAVAQLLQAVSAELGRPAVVGGFPAWSETPFLFNQLGVPGVYFAAGDLSNCHTTEEHLSVAELVSSTRALARFIVDYCGVSD